MEKPVVRLIKAELKNIKNVENGSIEFMNYSSVMRQASLSGSDVVGIYGQNGSGKTAMIEGLDILRYVLSGEPVPVSEYFGIIDDKHGTRLCASFFISTGKRRYLAEYYANLYVDGGEANGRIIVKSEGISYKIRRKTWCNERKLRFDNPFYDTNFLINSSSPVVLESEHVNQFRALDFVKSLHNIAVFASQRDCSVFFNGIVQSSLATVTEEAGEGVHLAEILKRLYQYAKHFMVVVKTSQLGAIHSNDILPINVHEHFNNALLQGCLPLVMKGNGTLPKTIYPIFEQVIDAINIALKAIVPRLQIVLNAGGEETTEKGIVLVNVDVYSSRDGKMFSTRYESEGIKRIISLLNCLISVYNDENMCLVVDELDSGIFEYLLGELLGILNEEAKGQLIFTSHNLRPFEKLGAKNIICSTVNPKDRYIRLRGIQSNNNKRDFYIRSLVLGGQKETLYEQDDLDSIGYAFRKAGGNQQAVNIQLSDQFKTILDSGE